MNDIEHLALTVLTALACPILLPMIIGQEREAQIAEK